MDFPREARTEESPLPQSLPLPLLLFPLLFRCWQPSRCPRGSGECSRRRRRRRRSSPGRTRRKGASWSRTDRASLRRRPPLCTRRGVSSSAAHGCDGGGPSLRGSVLPCWRLHLRYASQWAKLARLLAAVYTSDQRWVWFVWEGRPKNRSTGGMSFFAVVLCVDPTKGREHPEQTKQGALSVSLWTSTHIRAGQNSCVLLLCATRARLALSGGLLYDRSEEGKEGYDGTTSIFPSSSFFVCTSTSLLDEHRTRRSGWHPLTPRG